MLIYPPSSSGLTQGSSRPSALRRQGRARRHLGAAGQARGRRRKAVGGRRKAEGGGGKRVKPPLHRVSDPLPMKWGGKEKAPADRSAGALFNSKPGLSCSSGSGAHPFRRGG